MKRHFGLIGHTGWWTLLVIMAASVLFVSGTAFSAVRGDVDGDGDVDRNDIRVLLVDRNKLVGDSLCGAACDLDGDGRITGLDARQIVLLCTLPRCATPVSDTTAPIVSIATPVNLSLLNTSPVVVTGTVDDASATVKVNGTPATVSGNSYTATIPLGEGNNTLTAVAKDAANNVGTASIQVALDTTTPTVTIDSPPDGLVTNNPSITVAGMINDIVVGTVNGDQATVQVNGIPAQVANRSFLAADIALNPGPNTITAFGTDRAGNSATASIQVIFNPVVGGPTINLLSGNNQTGRIGAELPGPLVVQLKDAAGNPLPGKTVIFKVMENNGTISGSPNKVRSIALTSNAQGQAQVRWTLGTRSGAGNNVVDVSSVGIPGMAVFTAIATPAPADKINVDTGNNQTGVVGQPLPHPFVAIVTDGGHNRLGGIPVTFTVFQGGGSFNSQATFTVNTDSDGRASAALSLGLQEGIGNNVVEATFPGNLGVTASFSASGKTAGDPAATKVSGVVLDNTDQPIAGVTMHIEGTNLTTQTNAEGQFVLMTAPVGHAELVADGSTAQRSGTWPTLHYELVTVSGQDNTIGMPIFLLPIDTESQICVTATKGGVLTLPDIPGFSLNVLAGSATFPDGTKEGCVSVTTVHADKIPMTPNFGQQPRLIVTIQPPGVHFDPPAPITVPNADGHAPGEVTELYSFDHDLGQFISIGTGSVSEDGSVITSDPGVGIIKGGWHCGGNPQQTGSCCDCPTCKKCTGNNCVADNSQAPPQGSPNDCRKEVCSGGGVQSVANDTDKPSDVCQDCGNGQVVSLANGAVSSDGVSCCFGGQPQTNHPISDLAKCPNRVPNPSHVRESNGCGGEGLSSAVPDNPMLVTHLLDASYLLIHGFSDGDFTQSCNGHDICYDTCNSVKNTCDTRFGNSMNSVCFSDYSGFFDGVNLLECLAFSLTYESVVSSINSFYDSAQKNACNCCFG